MYSIKWAEKVYSTYMDCNARAQNMPRVIEQAAARLLGWELRQVDVKRHLVASIAGRGCKSLWTDYKRLCRRTPLDGKLLERVCKAIYWPERDEWNQLKFDFETENELCSDQEGRFF